MDSAAVVGDAQDLTITGTVTVDLENVGTAGTGVGFDVLLFEDSDGDGAYDPAVDNALGSAPSAALAAGGTASVPVPADGRVLFRDNLIYALADATDVVPESDETNNLWSTGLECSVVGSPGMISATLEWSWTSSMTEPNALNVMMTPSVVDLDGDGVPEVVFGATPSTGGGGVEVGFLRALSGATGAELFTQTDPTLRVNTACSIATGDIDGDGAPEIVACDNTGFRLIAFESDGTFKWRSGNLETINWGAPSIADLDGDGTPEIVVGRQALDATGNLLWTGTGGQGNAGAGPLSLVADVDQDGSPDVVTGNTVYSSTGTILFQNVSLADGHCAVANFDADPEAEIVAVSGGTVRLIDLGPGASLTQTWSAPIPFGGTGGPPTIADFDADGMPEIGVAGASRYAVFEADGSLKWDTPTQDGSSNRTGSSVFDFNGDGAAEVVYRDERFLRIYEGATGVVLFETAMSSCTWHEYVLVADVDADSQAEIVAVANNNCGFGPQRGVFVFGATNGDWVPTRPIWNQHTYHITNVEDDGTIPAVEPTNWLVPSGAPYNSYRQNALNPLNPGAAADLTASFVRIDPATVMPSVIVRVGNGGDAVAPAGTSVAFYDGDPAMSGSLLGVVATTAPLAPGAFEDVRLLVPTVPTETWASVDDDGNGVGSVVECDETNNVHGDATGPFFVYCRGTNCPCGNDATGPDEGCATSTGSGARLLPSGTASVAADDLVLTLDQLPLEQFGLVYLGPMPEGCAQWGDGLRGIQPGPPGSFLRLPTGNAGFTGDIVYGPGIVAQAQTLHGSAATIVAGSTWYFQGYFRDTQGGSPCGFRFNLSNALAVTFGP
ncbi:MAG: FG-GAP-like repeat-containing protein [Planctomycetota bacterium]